MLVVSRHYKNPNTQTTTMVPMVFAGYVDDRLIEQYYIEDVKSNVGFEVVWKFMGKELRT